MKKILLLSSHFLPNDGGIARLVTELFFQLKSKKLDVSTILLEKENVKLEKDIQQIKQPRIIKEISAFFKIRNHKEIIISAIWYPEGLISHFSKSKFKIILVHGSELLPKDSKIKEFIFSKLRKTTLSNADLIIANSKFTKSIVTTITNNTRIKVINPGVNTAFFKPSNKTKAKTVFEVEGKFVLSSLSVIRKHKGLDIILNSVSLLPPHLKENIILLLGGKGEALSFYKSLAKKLQINHLIKWLGYIPDSNLPSFYNASDLFLLTSKYNEETKNIEGFGMVLLEAQACGVPVIGTKSGGIVDAIEEGNGGFFISNENPEELKNLIIKLYDSPELISLNGKLARNRCINLFSWDNYTNQIVKAIDSQMA